MAFPVILGPHRYLLMISLACKSGGLKGTLANERAPVSRREHVREVGQKEDGGRWLTGRRLKDAFVSRYSLRRMTTPANSANSTIPNGMTSSLPPPHLNAASMSQSAFIVRYSTELVSVTT